MKSILHAASSPFTWLTQGGHKLTFKPLGTWRKGGETEVGGRKRVGGRSLPLPLRTMPTRSREALVPDPSPRPGVANTGKKSTSQGVPLSGGHAAEDESREPHFRSMDQWRMSPTPHQTCSYRKKENCISSRRALRMIWVWYFPLVPLSPPFVTGMTLTHTVPNYQIWARLLLLVAEKETGLEGGEASGSPSTSKQHRSGSWASRLSGSCIFSYDEIKIQPS